MKSSKTPADSSKDEDVILPRSINLTESEIASLREDLREATAIYEKRWGKIRKVSDLKSDGKS